VVASWLVLVPGAWVTPVAPIGIEGAPVNAGEFSGARDVSLGWT
jgi:hypothetical protein